MSFSPPWAVFDFTNLTDEEYCSQINIIREKFDVYAPDPSYREVPPVKPSDSPQSFDDFFTLVFKSSGGRIVGLYQKRDQYLFASKVANGPGIAQPFERVRGVDFLLPNVDTREVNLTVKYDSLQGSSIPSYKREDLCNAVTTLAQGFDNNSQWGPALATLVGATSDAFKSYGMERHVSRGLNIRSDGDHLPSNRLIRINKSWAKVSKRIRTRNFDYVLIYKNENGEDIEEVVTEFSARTIYALINSKDGTKEEKSIRKLDTKDQGKRKRDGNDEKGSGGSKKSMGRKGRSKRRKENSPPTRKDSGVVAEDESDFPMETVIALEDSGIQKFDLSTIEARTLDEYLEIMHKSDPPIDYSKAPKPFAVRMVPRLHYSPSDSDDSSDFSDSDFESEEEFELQKENSPEDATKEVEFQPNATPEDLISGLNAPASSILEEVSEIQNMIIPKLVLVKHGTKREAEIGDKGSELAKEMASQMEGSGKKSADVENQVAGDVQEEVSEIQNMILPKPVLVKHGTKHEAEIGDKGCELAKEMASQMEGSGKKSTDVENQVAGA